MQKEDEHGPRRGPCSSSFYYTLETRPSHRAAEAEDEPVVIDLVEGPPLPMLIGDVLRMRGARGRCSDKPIVDPSVLGSPHHKKALDDASRHHARGGARLEFEREVASNEALQRNLETAWMGGHAASPCDRTAR